MVSSQVQQVDIDTSIPPTPDEKPSPMETVSPEKPWDATQLPWARKIHIIIAGFTCTFNGNLGSSMPSGALDALSEHFSVTRRLDLTLLNSLYMVGYVLGPLLFGPLSEYIGRRPVLIGTFCGYLTMMLACSGAPNFSALLAFRLLCGICAAAPTTVISGLYADILDVPSHRGTAMAVYMSVTTMGPLAGPIISGFASIPSWRWPFWVAAMIAALGLPLVLTIPETFAPVLQNREAKRRQKEGVAGGESGAAEPVELHAFNPRKIFLRPAYLLVTEPILLSTSLYLTLAYAVFYLMFQAYPIVFQDLYGLEPGIAGLAYIPIGVGVIASMVIFWAYTSYYDRAVKEDKAWAKREIYRRLPIACIASPLMVVALFWLGWLAQPNLSPIIPSLGGFFWGIGFQLIFMGMSNYITDVFTHMSASAQAAAACMRSVGAIFLPMAAAPMYRDLGRHWAPSLLGFVALAMGVIPFVFIRYGDDLAKRSKYARRLYGQ